MNVLTTTDSTTEKEVLLLEAPAALPRGRELVSGRLRLTDQRLRISPEGAGRAGPRAEIPLDQIGSMAKPEPRWRQPMGLLLRLRTGEQLRFALRQRDPLARMLRRLGIAEVGSEVSPADAPEGTGQELSPPVNATTG